MLLLFNKIQKYEKPCVDLIRMFIEIQYKMTQVRYKSALISAAVQKKSNLSRLQTLETRTIGSTFACFHKVLSPHVVNRFVAEHCQWPVTFFLKYIKRRKCVIEIVYFD